MPSRVSDLPCVELERGVSASLPRPENEMLLPALLRPEKDMLLPALLRPEKDTLLPMDERRRFSRNFFHITEFEKPVENVAFALLGAVMLFPFENFGDLDCIVKVFYVCGRRFLGK